MTGHASDDTPTWLNGQLLIAMPGMSDPRFGRTVLYICTHSSEGAMGLVINRAFGEIRFNDLMNQLGIEGASDQDRPVHFGGPVDSSRGFVLHSADFRADQTLVIDDGFLASGLGSMEMTRLLHEGGQNLRFDDVEFVQGDGGLELEEGEEVVEFSSYVEAMAAMRGNK